MVAKLSDESLIQVGKVQAEVISRLEARLAQIASEHDPVRSEILRRGLWYRMMQKD